jgi:PAS domain S-box-containing protein
MKIEYHIISLLTSINSSAKSYNSQWAGRFSWTDETTINPGIMQSGTTLFSVAKQYMVTNTRVISNNKVNEFRFGLNQFKNTMGQEMSGVTNVVEEVGIPNLKYPDPDTWGIPTMRDMQGVIIFWNHGAEKLLGWTSDEALGKHANTLLHTQFPQPLEAIETEVLRAGLWEGELVHTRRDGTPLLVASRWAVWQQTDKGRNRYGESGRCTFVPVLPPLPFCYQLNPMRRAIWAASGSQCPCYERKDAKLRGD